MTGPPVVLDGARVMAYALIGAVQKPTGATVHSGIAYPGDVAGLALASYDGDGDLYIFYCDESWKVLSDTCHPDVSEAVAQAEFEFTGLTFVAVQ